MKKNKLSISVGIPAYNEESNIKFLLESLLKQDSSNFKLLEIIVISDKSIDHTVQQALEVQDKRIKMVENNKRIGQAESQNKILRMFSGDILVLLNADVLPANKYLIKNIIKPFYEDFKIGLVSGKVVPLRAQGYIESVINYSVLTKQTIYEQINHGDNVYLCHGRVRAISKEFAKSFRWKQVVGEDAFSYLACKDKHYKFYYKSNAVINYRSPQSLSDHIKQSTRFYQNRQDLEKYFPKELIENSFFIPKKTLLNTSLKYYIKSPIKSVIYITILVLSKLKGLMNKNTTVEWDISISSKTLKK